jgi:hypothetical protein
MKVPAYAAFAFVGLFLFASGKFGQAQAQSGATNYYRCHTLIRGSTTVYASPLIATSTPMAALSQDWTSYVRSTYSLGVGGSQCVYFGNSLDHAQFSMNYEEKGWSNLKIVRVDYTFGAGPAAQAPSGQTVAAASTVSVTPAPSSSGRPTVKAYMSCSTAVAGGFDRYYTDVFAAELGAPTRRIPIGFSVDRQPVDPASVQEILNRFHAYLTQKGYRYAPGSAVACDLASTEAAARAAQHKRAYEGVGCSSGCGKVIETGWRNN